MDEKKMLKYLGRLPDRYVEAGAMLEELSWRLDGLQHVIEKGLDLIRDAFGVGIRSSGSGLNELENVICNLVCDVCSEASKDPATPEESVEVSDSSSSSNIETTISLRKYTKEEHKDTDFF